MKKKRSSGSNADLAVHRKPLPDIEFPYEYGSDLHWLWGWGHRIKLRLSGSERDLHEYDCMVFRPDRTARDAMTRFSVKYPFAVKSIDDCLTFVEARFAEFLADPDAIAGFENAFDSLRHTIATSVDVIAKGEAAKKPNRPTATHTEPATTKKAKDETLAIEALKRDVDKLKRTTKKKTKTELIREQRNKFSRSRRPNRTWDEIYQAYRSKHPDDDTASPATLRLSFRRDPTDNRQ